MPLHQTASENAIVLWTGNAPQSLRFFSFICSSKQNNKHVVMLSAITLQATALQGGQREPISTIINGSSKISSSSSSRSIHFCCFNRIKIFI